MPSLNNRSSSILRFRQYLRRHERVQVIIGAVLVFTTFVVKEAWRDHFKDIQEAIAAAQGVFLIRTDVNHLQEELEGAQVEEQDAQAVVGAKKTSQFAAHIESDLACWNSVLDAIDDLLATVPHNRASEKTSSSLRSELQEFEAEVDKLKGVNVYQDMNRIHGKVISAGEDVESFGKKALKEARKEGSKSQKLYETCNFIGNFTFAAGWLLALVGRLVGVPGLADP